MKPAVNIFKSFALLCFAMPFMTFATDHETIDTDPETSKPQFLEQEAHCGWGTGSILNAFSGNYLPKSAHIITHISSLDSEVRFEDGSAWKINPEDYALALQWFDSKTPVSVTQNTSWFSNDYKFRLVNRSTGSSIATNLFQGPWKGGEKSHYVIEYDIQQGTVKLSSREEVTRWEVHLDDLQKFREWNFNDSIPVIIGQNAKHDSCWGDQSEALLINVRKTKSFVRAHQY